jgi:hypothetical protein
MRTTLTLDEDVAAKLKAEMRRSGKSFRDIVNDTLRYGLVEKRVATRRRLFKVEARDLGNLRPGLSLDNVGELLEQIEGSLHR